MTDLIYHFTVFGAFVITGITLRHAWGDGERIAFLGTAIAYGFLLEKTTIVLFGTHSYPTGRFFLYLWGVPVSVPLAWGVIMYASLMAGRHVGFQGTRLPVFAGLFALHLSLAIDVIAIRVPFWTWHLSGVWFGVPVVNFVGWYSVAFLFTACFLSLGAKTEGYVLAGLASTVASTALLVVIVGIWLGFVSPSAVVEVVLFGGLIVISLVELTRTEVRPDPRLDRFPVETFVSVLLIHLFYLQTNLYYGYYRESPMQLYVGIAMLLVGLVVYSIPYTGAETRIRFVRIVRRKTDSEPVEGGRR